MPGNLFHFSSAPEDIRSSMLGLKGVIAPDLWKYNTPTKEEYLQFFDGIADAPSYEQVLYLCDVEHGGTHFGSKPGDTNHANFEFLTYLFETKQLDEGNLFFKGYIHHLRVDKNFYADTSLCDQIAFNKDYEIDCDMAMSALHLDWDKTNQAISTWYPEVLDIVSTMPEKVQNVIGYATGDTKYIYIDNLKQFIDYMREPRSLEELLNW